MARQSLLFRLCLDSSYLLSNNANVPTFSWKVIASQFPGRVVTQQPYMFELLYNGKIHSWAMATVYKRPEHFPECYVSIRKASNSAKQVYENLLICNHTTKARELRLIVLRNSDKKKWFYIHLLCIAARYAGREQNTERNGGPAPCTSFFRTLPHLDPEGIQSCKVIASITVNVHI